MEPTFLPGKDVLSQIRGLIGKLSPSEKHELLGELWNDLNDSDSNDIPFPEWQIRELEQRVAEYDAEPVKAGSRSIEEVIQRIVSKHGR
jgi:putative addiction module component (TIGR02574 family)